MTRPQPQHVSNSSALSCIRKFGVIFNSARLRPSSPSIISVVPQSSPFDHHCQAFSLPSADLSRSRAQLLSLLCSSRFSPSVCVAVFRISGSRSNASPTCGRTNRGGSIARMEGMEGVASFRFSMHSFGVGSSFRSLLRSRIVIVPCRFPVYLHPLLFQSRWSEEDMRLCGDGRQQMQPVRPPAAVGGRSARTQIGGVPV